MKPAAEELRQALPSDGANLVSLINRAFTIAQPFRTGSRTNIEQVQQMLGDGKFLLLIVDGKLVACVYLRLTGERAYLGTLSVDPAWRKQGIGTRMMREAENYCRAAGCKTIDIRIVNVREELPGIYRRWGFVETGTQTADAIKDAIRPIHFVIMSKTL
jgi:ribosomal protein S18 acetylase RimI-like enzyme